MLVGDLAHAALHFHIRADYTMVLPAAIVSERLAHAGLRGHDRETLMELGTIRRGPHLDVLVHRPQGRGCMLVMVKEHYARTYEPHRVASVAGTYETRCSQLSSGPEDLFGFLEDYRQHYMASIRTRYLEEAGSNAPIDAIDGVRLTEDSGETLAAVEIYRAVSPVTAPCTVGSPCSRPTRKYSVAADAAAGTLSIELAPPDPADPQGDVVIDIGGDRVELVR